VDETERRFIELAIDEAEKSAPEDTRVHPKVGVVAVKDLQLLGSAHRGEIAGSHAEYVLEEKLKAVGLAGATLYTTLEPCTTRQHPKIPCAQRLVDRKVSRVVIGMLDPNSEISGKGQMLLRQANVATDFFPPDLMARVEELNRDFIRAHRQSGTHKGVDDKFVELNRKRPMDEWYRVINTIYWNRNLYRDQVSIFAHLVEVVGGLSLLASQKKKAGALPESFVPKALAWWMALCGRIGVRSVADMVWAKFPYVCPYCLLCPHDPDECSERKASRLGPDWSALRSKGTDNVEKRPGSLGAWQRMFSGIYPAQQTEEYGPTFARCTEELGELAEALRVFPAAPEYFLNEAADMCAWLMHIQNVVDLKKGTAKKERGVAIETEFCRAYPDRCLDCDSEICTCPLILGTTIGRIAHELPGGQGLFMPPDAARLAFQPRNVYASTGS
jgi:pyrimidine deaminase RibD-like protein/NTP pyrophosphatase (non-canonical NTP hydrolase)